MRQVGYVVAAMFGGILCIGPSRAEPNISQAAFSDLLNAHRASYLQSATDLQRHDQTASRRDAICALGNASAKGWQGKVVDVSAGTVDTAGIRMDMGGFGLWHFPGGVAGLATIKRGSPMYATLLQLRPGDVVAIDGSFQPGRADCFHELSSNDAQSFNRPEFSFEVVSIRKAHDRVSANVTD